jgi:hypothetical protein
MVGRCGAVDATIIFGGLPWGGGSTSAPTPGTAEDWYGRAFMAFWSGPSRHRSRRAHSPGDPRAGSSSQSCALCASSRRLRQRGVFCWSRQVRRSVSSLNIRYVVSSVVSTNGGDNVRPPPADPLRRQLAIGHVMSDRRGPPHIRSAASTALCGAAPRPTASGAAQQMSRREARPGAGAWCCGAPRRCVRCRHGICDGLDEILG